MVGSNFESDAAESYRKARQLMDDNQLEEAIAWFQKSAEAVPHFKTLELLGECYVRLGRLTEAVVPLAAAVGLNKGVRAASMLAEVFLSLGDYGTANDLAETALSRDRSNRKALQVKNEVADYVAARNQ